MGKLQAYHILTQAEALLRAVQLQDSIAAQQAKKLIQKVNQALVKGELYD